MKPENERLLNDLWSEGRSATLAAGNVILRRKRRVRAVVRFSCAALGIAAIALLCWPKPQSLRPAPLLAMVETPKTNSVISNSIPTLTDEELLALFPGTPVGLAVVNGKKRLIFPNPEDERKFVMHFEPMDTLNEPASLEPQADN